MKNRSFSWFTFTTVTTFTIVLLGSQLVRADWDNLTPEQKIKAQANYERYQKMSTEEKEALEAGWDHYKQMNSEQKAKLDNRFERYQSLSASQRKWVRARGQARHRNRSHSHHSRRKIRA